MSRGNRLLLGLLLAANVVNIVAVGEGAHLLHAGPAARTSIVTASLRGVPIPDVQPAQSRVEVVHELGPQLRVIFSG